MKKTALIIILITTFNSFSQINFGIGIYQEFGNIYSKNSSYTPLSNSLKRSNIGASILLSKIKSEDGWYPEFKIDFSLTSDTSFLINNEAANPILPQIIQDKTTDQISVDYDYNIAQAKSKHQNIQFTLNRQVSKYISVGGGFGLNFIQSKFNDLNGTAKYDWNSSSSSYLLSTSNNLRVNEKSLTDISLIVPLNLRFHLPIGSNELILSNSFIFDVNNRNYFQTLLLFKI